MDTRTLAQIQHSENGLALLSEGEAGIKAMVRRKGHTGNRHTGRRGRKHHIRIGREVVKSGMAASLAVTMLTGMKLLRPMSLHPVASWVFIGFSIIHMVAYDKMGGKCPAQAVHTK